jgi:predicted MFS family arabinose efflux permease
MSGLAVLWAVQGASGSFGHAGAATGAFAVADALAGPQIGRLVDRWGQRRVMPVTTVLFAVAALVLIVACAGVWQSWSLVALAALVGATVPAVGALSAARWRRIAAPGAVPVALSLEGAVNDAAFLAGPVLVTTASTVLTPWSGLALAVFLLVGGMAGLSSDAASEPSPGGRAALSLVPAVPLMFAGYALVGGCVALVLIPGSILLQQAAVPEVYTQAMTWINSASALGIATSAPLIGVVVQDHGWPAGFLVLAALTACLPMTLAALPAPVAALPAPVAALPAPVAVAALPAPVAVAALPAPVAVAGDDRGSTVEQRGT